jgi:hypothetical protein
MTRGLTLLGLGAGLMFVFDPDRGRRRRALLRDQWVRRSRELVNALEVTARDLRNRATGLAAEVSSLFSDGTADDATIEARVRSALGRATSHPRAIRVEARDGRVSLSGPVLAAEAERVIKAAWSARGVRAVENRLELHPEPGDHPALQGGTTRTGARPELLQETWSPTTKLLVGLGAGMLAMKAMRHPVVTTLAVGAAGAAVAAGALACASSTPRDRDRPRRWTEGAGAGAGEIAPSLAAGMAASGVRSGEGRGIGPGAGEP